MASSLLVVLMTQSTLPQCTRTILAMPFYGLFYQPDGTALLLQHRTHVHRTTHAYKCGKSNPPTGIVTAQSTLSATGYPLQ